MDAPDAISRPHVISRIEAIAFRYPVARAVETSFGRMTDRPAVFVRVEDADGCFGWGEVFANWPAAGAEHRVNLLARDVGPLVIGQTVTDPGRFFDDLSAKTHIRALQCGEFGPFRQVIAGIDTAIWDLKARAADMPLRRLLSPDAVDAVPAYASGIHIASAPELIPRLRSEGYTAFKVKIGFDFSRDLDTLCALCAALQPGERLFTDANQGFDTETALRFVEAAEDLGLGWLEEPIVADGPDSDWTKIAARSRIPLAGGENIAGEAAFAHCIEQGVLQFVQPDVAKWGGVSGCLRVARAVRDAGRTYCPHFLGGGIGLAASAEILAAVGGEGLLEVDVNPNPLRDAFGASRLERDSGLWQTGTAPGLGIETIPEDLSAFVSHRVELN